MRANMNGRLYPPEVLKKAVEKAQERVRSGRMIGGLEAPVRPNNVTHIVRDLKTDGSSIIADIELVGPNRDMLKAMIDRNMLGISTRGTGSIRPDGGICDDFVLREVSLVSTPDAHRGYAVVEPDVITVLSELADGLDDEVPERDAEEGSGGDGPTLPDVRP